MARPERTFRVDLVTPTGTVGRFEAVSARLPGADGMVGILGGRAPLMTTLRAGALFVRDAGAACHEFFVEGGFARMDETSLTVLAEQCLPIEQIDAEEAWEQIARARRMPAETDADLDRREEALAAARIKFAMAQRARRRRGLVGAATLAEE